ncbi:MAG: hypothetical protein JW863_12560 [Chitinispirillaceae bacterium]|nr:hypothetical protein [Chitinispirillaceae bacterium]
MNLSLKRIDVDAPVHRQSGSALPIVMFFAAIGLITVFTYLVHQFSFSRASLRSPASLQALLNARSGIYKSLYLLIDSTATDTFKTISTLDSAFGADMFGDVTDTLSPNSDKPQFDGTPVTYTLFENDTPAFGECEVTLEPSGGIFSIRSTGRFRTFERTVTAVIGSRVPALPDTIVICRNTYPWERTPSNGTVVSVEETKLVNSSWYHQLNDRYLTVLSESDTFLLDPPLVIQSSHDVHKIDSVVQGPLLIDGTQMNLVWKDTGTVVIKGDLQITGDAQVEGITFVVAGEIKILDEAKVLHSGLFTRSRLFIGDQSTFEGNALAMHSITIYGKASVTGRSSLIAGSTRSTGANVSSDSLRFSILISEEASVDAVCIAVETPGSIKTDEGTTISGILWAQHLVCHRGRMAGLICAARVVDCDNPEQMVNSATSGIAALPEDSTGVKKDSTLTPTTTQLQNTIPGLIEPLAEIAQYHLPFFIGRLSIISWKEE